MQAEQVVELKLNFSTADAEYPTIALSAGRLKVEFVDWRENKVEVSFENTCAFKWEEAPTPGPEPRDDAVYEFINSPWLAEHRRQQVRGEKEVLRHFKLCFNACGVLEVVAERIVVAT